MIHVTLYMHFLHSTGTTSPDNSTGLKLLYLWFYCPNHLKVLLTTDNWASSRCSVVAVSGSVLAILLRWAELDQGVVSIAGRFCVGVAVVAVVGRMLRWLMVDLLPSFFPALFSSSSYPCPQIEQIIYLFAVNTSSTLPSTVVPDLLYSNLSTQVQHALNQITAAKDKHTKKQSIFQVSITSSVH